MTTEHLTFTGQIIRLSKQKIGLREAALLFALRDGATTDDLVKATREHKDVIKGRLNAIRTKGLIESEFNPKGFAVYHPTARGMKIIDSTTR